MSSLCVHFLIMIFFVGNFEGNLKCHDLHLIEVDNFIRINSDIFSFYLFIIYSYLHIDNHLNEKTYIIYL